MEKLTPEDIEVVKKEIGEINFVIGLILVCIGPINYLAITQVTQTSWFTVLVLLLLNGFLMKVTVESFNKKANAYKAIKERKKAIYVGKVKEKYEVGSKHVHRIIVIEEEEFYCDEDTYILMSPGDNVRVEFIPEIEVTLRITKLQNK